MQIIPTRIHGILDYLMGAVLIIVPLVVFGGGTETLVPVVLGLGLIAYSLLTNYEWGVMRIIPMPVHLGLDVLAGIVLIVSPWLFGFADETWLLHVILGVAEVGAALFSEREPASPIKRLGRTPRGV